MEQRTKAGAFGIMLFGSLGIGVAVGLVAGIVTAAISGSCYPEEECMSSVYGLVIGTYAGGIAAMIAVVVLAIRLGLGAILGAGTAITVPLLIFATWQAPDGPAEPWLLLAAVVIAVAVVLQACHRPSADGSRRWSRPSRVSGLIAAGALVLGLIPAGLTLLAVRSEQQRIDALAERPLQTDLDGTWPFTVDIWDSSITYRLVLPSNGDRSTDVIVSVRNLAPGQAPCTGFTDRYDGPVTVTDCTALGQNLWRGEGSHGEARYFAHDGDRQWAYVRSDSYDSRTVQKLHDARAQQVAQSLQHRSAFPLAAESANCGFCEWLSSATG